MRYLLAGKRMLGAITIEFSIGIFIFIVFIVSIMELNRYILIINTTESLLSESTRQVRIFDSDKFNKTYEQRLSQLSEKNGKLWNFIIEPKKICIKATQYLSVSDLALNQSVDNCNHCPIVSYEITYKYSPMISLGLLGNSTISRKILTVQEHEGWN